MVHKRKYASGKVAWRYVFDAPGSTREAREQIAKAGFATKAEAVKAEAERRIAAQQEYELRKIQGVSAPLPKNLGNLIAEFLKEHGEKRLAAKTMERYRDQAAMLSPEILALPLSEITSLHLSREWNRLLQSGGRFRKTKAAKPLAAKTVRNIAGVVSSAFARGIEWGLIGVNPVPHSKPPVPKKRQGLALTPEQQTLLIEAATLSWGLAAFLELDASVGARRGELLALTWSDVADGKVAIRRSLSQTRAGLEFKQPKNGLGRTLTVPPSAQQALEAHRQAQQVLRDQFGPTYSSENLVFCNADGSPLRPDSVSSSVSALFHRLKLPKGASLHTLRHSHGSHMLAAGVSLPDVSKRLGHSSVYVTATVYAHAMAGGDEAAAQKWEEYQNRKAVPAAEAPNGKPQ